MPTIKWNAHFWNTTYPWSRQGDEWSTAWGSTDSQWYGSILPRIRVFLPVGTILEIAPGFGRWTQFLKNLCEHSIVVDLSEKCIQACKERFRDSSHITYHVNDGASLEMVRDASVDFVFSFDSLVHAEDETIKKYVAQLSSKLTRNDVAFIHHSNLGEYKTFFSLLRRLQDFFPPAGQVAAEDNRHAERKRLFDPLQWAIGLASTGIIDRSHLRAISMTAGKFRQYAAEAELCCISQEIINWGSRRLIDCFSIVTGNNSVWYRENKVLRNSHCMKEAKHIRTYSKLYGSDSF